MKFNFTRTTSLEDAKAFLSQALSSGKFPHALLIHGAEGVGQNPLLLDLADILLCDSAVERPCRKCPACAQGRRGNSERLHFLLPLEKGGGDDERKELDGPQVEEMVAKTEAFLGDPYGYGLTEKDSIRIVQVRDLQGRLSYAGASRNSRVVLIPWAENFQPGAANALLKTLEEPPAGTYFLLSTANRKAVLQTILSRCTGLPVAALEDGPFAAAVAARKEWWDGAPPSRLIPFSEGSLGVLLHLYRNGGEALLEEASIYLAAALQVDWRAFSDYLDGSAAFEDMESASRLLHFVLRMIGCLHRLRVEEGPARSPGWIAKALARQGWDGSLSAPLEILDGAADLAGFAALNENILSGVQGYSKPKMAALGSWLERDMKMAAR